jgi:hypothetical protein
MSSKKRILFFSPYQAVWQHSFPERKLADILNNSDDFEIKYMGCQGVLKRHCVSMSANNLNSKADEKKKQKICNTCKNFSKKTWDIENKYFIDSYITSEDKDLVKSLISKIALNNVSKFTYDDIPIGLIAPYELLLNHKISILENISEVAWSDYLAAIENCLYASISLKKLLQAEAFDRVVVYNANYGVNHTIKLVAKKFNIPTIHFHYSIELARWGDLYFLTTELPPYFLRDRKNYFEKNINNLNIQYSQFNRVYNHIKKLFESTSLWVYSERRTGNKEVLKDKFQIKENDSIALISLSSFDELFGIEYSIANNNYVASSNSLFFDQFKWLEHTIEFFSKNPKLKLIIRVHPREYPNKRENVISDISKRYEELLKNLPSNIFINFPDQKISIYDLLPIIKLHITSWSSVGLESTLLGIPTISVTKGLSLYSNEYVNFCPNSIDEYEKLILKYLELPVIRSFEFYEKARNWLLYDFIQTTIEIPHNDGFKQIPSIFSKILFKMGLIGFDSYYKYIYYSNKVSILEKEKKVIFDFFNTLKPIYDIKNETLENNLKFEDEIKYLEKLGIKFSIENTL